MTKDTPLYYVEAYNRLSHRRERVSAYVSDRQKAQQIISRLQRIRPASRPYLRPALKETTLQKTKTRPVCGDAIATQKSSVCGDAIATLKDKNPCS